MRFSRVDFPQPEWPMRETNSPTSIEMFTSRRTKLAPALPENPFHTPLISSVTTSPRDTRPLARVAEMPCPSRRRPLRSKAPRQ